MIKKKWKLPDVRKADPFEDYSWQAVPEAHTSDLSGAAAANYLMKIALLPAAFMHMPLDVVDVPEAPGMGAHEPAHDISGQLYRQYAELEGPSKDIPTFYNILGQAGRELGETGLLGAEGSPEDPTGGYELGPELLETILPMATELAMLGPGSRAMVGGAGILIGEVEQTLARGIAKIEEMAKPAQEAYRFWHSRNILPKKIAESGTRLTTLAEEAVVTSEWWRNITEAQKLDALDEAERQISHALKWTEMSMASEDMMAIDLAMGRSPTTPRPPGPGGPAVEGEALGLDRLGPGAATRVEGRVGAEYTSGRYGPFPEPTPATMERLSTHEPPVMSPPVEGTDPYAYMEQATRMQLEVLNQRRRATIGAAMNRAKMRGTTEQRELLNELEAAGVDFAEADQALSVEPDKFDRIKRTFEDNMRTGIPPKLVTEIHDKQIPAILRDPRYTVTTLKPHHIQEEFDAFRAAMLKDKRVKNVKVVGSITEKGASEKDIDLLIELHDSVGDKWIEGYARGTDISGEGMEAYSTLREKLVELGFITEEEMGGIDLFIEHRGKTYFEEMSREPWAVEEYPYPEWKTDWGERQRVAMARRLNEGLPKESGARITPEEIRLSGKDPNLREKLAKLMERRIRNQPYFKNKEQGFMEMSLLMRLGEMGLGAVTGGAVDEENRLRGAIIGALVAFTLGTVLRYGRGLGTKGAIGDIGRVAIKGTKGRVYRVRPQAVKVGQMALSEIEAMMGGKNSGEYLTFRFHYNAGIKRGESHAVSAARSWDVIKHPQYGAPEPWTSSAPGAARGEAVVDTPWGDRHKIHDDVYDDLHRKVHIDQDDAFVGMDAISEEPLTSLTELDDFRVWIRDKHGEADLKTFDRHFEKFMEEERLASEGYPYDADDNTAMALAWDRTKHPSTLGVLRSERGTWNIEQMQEKMVRQAEIEGPEAIRKPEHPRGETKARGGRRELQNKMFGKASGSDMGRDGLRKWLMETYGKSLSEMTEAEMVLADQDLTRRIALSKIFPPDQLDQAVKIRNVEDLAMTLHGKKAQKKINTAVRRVTGAHRDLTQLNQQDLTSVLEVLPKRFLRTRGLGALIRQPLAVEDVLNKMGSWGKYITRTMRRERRHTEYLWSKWHTPLEQEIAGLNKSQMDEIVAALHPFEKNNRQVVMPKDPKLQEIAVRLRQDLNEIGHSREAIGDPVMMADGSERPFEMLDDYFPLHHAPEDLTSSILIKRRIIEHLIESGQAAGVNEAVSLYDDFIKGAISNKFGNLDYAREAWIEPESIDLLHSLSRYYYGAARRISRHKYYGSTRGAEKFPEKMNNWLNALQQDVGPDEFIFARNAIERHFKHAAVDDAMSDMLKRIRSFETMAHMGLAQIMNASEPVHTAVFAGFNNFAKGFARAIRSTSKMDAREIVARNAAAVGSTIRDLFGEAGGAGSMTGKFLKWSGFSPIEKWNRKLASHVGIQYIESTVAKLQRNPTSKRLRNMLDELLLNADDILRNGLDDETLIKGAMELSNRTQKRTGVIDMPMFMSHPMGRILAMFKTFAYGSARLMVRDFLFALPRNPERLARLLVAFPIVGEIVGDVRNLATGNVRDTEGLARLAENFAYVGTLGILYDFYRSVQFGEGSIKGFMVGPVGSDIASIMDGTYQWLAEGKGRKLSKQALRMLPPPATLLRGKAGQKAILGRDLFPPPTKKWQIP